MMENNSAAVECLIRFYINTKHVLKTKQLIERAFMDELVKHCKNSGFDRYSNEQIKKSWKDLVSKYMDLKNKGTKADQANWKYFEILDSCYEHGDFHNVLYPKFSEEMMWLLIQCFLKRRALRQTEKHSRIIANIHKEFLECGYLYITEQDVANQWKHLNKKYVKLKDDPENFKKLPYLQALRGFHEENSKYVPKMIFTGELTEILIERFTEKKIWCAIHGYDSDQVLSEIQSEFKDLGFYFSKEDIKDKWKKLSNIYKFLRTKRNNDTSWVHFNAMKKHFKDQILSAWDAEYTKINKSTPRRLRGRSKSVGMERSKNYSNTSHTDVVLEKPELMEKEYKQVSVKRISELRRRSISPKKLRTSNRTKEKEAIPQKIDDFNRNVLSTKKTQKRSYRISESSASKVHVINVNCSNIVQGNGNLTINLPSITKKFSDNDLPLKKRLRTDGDSSDMVAEAANEIKNSFSHVPVTDYAESQKLSTHSYDNKCLSQDEMREIIEKISHQNVYNNVINDELNNPRNCKTEELCGYSDIYENFSQDGLRIPKKEPQNSPPMCNYTNSVQAPPVLLVVIKVDSNNPSSNLNSDRSNESLRIQGTDSSSQNNFYNESNQEVKTKNEFLVKQEDQESNIHTDMSMDLINSTCKKLDQPSLDFTSETDLICKNKEYKNGMGCEEFTTHNRHSTGDCSHHIDNDGMSDVCSVAGNVTVYTTTEDSQSENNYCDEEKNSEALKPEAVKFREPLAVTDKIDKSDKVKLTNKTLNLNSKTPQVTRQQSGTDKIRLPVTGGGKIKEIFISPRELSKLKLINFKTQNNIMKKLNETNVKNTTESTVSVKSSLPNFKFPFQSIKLTGSRILDTANLLQDKNARNEDFDNERISSEAIDENGDLKDKLLTTVIDFQEQNNQEFIEIKNLLKQSNLLQRETNRLIRLALEKLEKS